MGKWIDHTRFGDIIRQIPDIFANAFNLDGKSFARLICFAENPWKTLEKIPSYFLAVERGYEQGR